VGHQFVGIICYFDQETPAHNQAIQFKKYAYWLKPMNEENRSTRREKKQDTALQL